MFDIQELLSHEFFKGEGYQFSVTNLIVIVVTLVVARIMSWLVASLWKRRFRAQGIQDEGRKFALITISKYLIYTLAIFLILGNSGLDIALLVAGSSVILVGIGFILKNIFIDIVSGIILMFERTVEINDIINYDGDAARVKYIGLRATKVETRDGIELIIPNSKFTNNRVTNWGHGHHQVRFHVRFPVAYGANPRRVAQVVNRVCKEHPDLGTKSRGSQVWVTEFTDSAMIFELLFWSNRLFPVEGIKSELRMNIYDALEEEGIHMPVPHRDMRIEISDPEKIPAQ